MTSLRALEVFGFVEEMLLNAWQIDSEEKLAHLKALWDIAKLVSPHVIALRAVFNDQIEGLGMNQSSITGFSRLLQKADWYVRWCDTRKQELIIDCKVPL